MIWAIISLVLTGTMIGVAWVTRARVVEAVRDLDRSQGEVLLASIRETLRNIPGPPDRSGLDSLLVRHANDGLKSVAFFGSDDRLIASAGTASGQGAVNLHPSGSEPLPVTTAGGPIRLLGFFRPTMDSAGVGPVWAPGSPAPDWRGKGGHAQGRRQDGHRIEARPLPVATPQMKPRAEFIKS
ncbi:MAG: hypothetical protein ACREL3_01110 [Gemmatimonadales bacterium]